MKLYRVEIEFVGYVLAENAWEAEDEYRREGVREDEPQYSHAREVTAGHVPDGDWAECIPWGADDDVTVGELLEAMSAPGEVTQAELEAAGQSRLPLGEGSE